MSRVTVFGFACGLAVLLAGCGGTPSQADIEKVIREGMRTEQGVEVASMNLTKQPDGGYTGTATADNGDTYDVTVDPPKARRFQWRASATQTTVERILRDKIEESYGRRVTRLELTKESPGAYAGTVELEDKTRWKVSGRMRGKEMVWQADPIR